MSNFKVLPIKNQLAQGIRERMVDQDGHQLFVSVVDESGYGPCRSCLKQFVAGEGRIALQEDHGLRLESRLAK